MNITGACSKIKAEINNWRSMAAWQTNKEVTSEKKLVLWERLL